MARTTETPEGIVSMHENAKFFGNSMNIEGWDEAVIWTPETPEVEDNVSMEDVGPATGMAPAVNNGRSGSVNEKVKGWNKYELYR